MKNKLISLAGAMMLVVAMAVSAVAAPAPSVDESIVPEIKGDIVASNGTVVKAEDITIGESKVAVDLKDEAVSKLVSGVNNAKVHSVFDVNLANADKVFANGGTVKIPFAVAGIAGKDVKVLHFNGTEWEVVPSTVSGNVVTATFTSLSPVAIVVGDAQTGGNVVEDDAMGMGFETIAVMGMALCAVVFFFSVKKARA